MHDDVLISDEELTALALAADPTELLDDDAVPFDGGSAEGLLPDWYMPAPQVSGGSRPSCGRRRCVGRVAADAQRSRPVCHLRHRRHRLVRTLNSSAVGRVRENPPRGCHTY